MTMRKLPMTALGPLLALAADAGLSADVAAQVPDTAAAESAADLISRVERAINGYVAACVSRKPQALSRVATSDVRIEYALDEPGAYLTFDASSLLAGCTASAPAGHAESHVANLWVFPTLDANAVFVQYDAPGSAGSIGHRQLALVEMRGDRISRMLNFGAVPSAIVASTMREAEGGLQLLPEG